MVSEISAVANLSNSPCRFFDRYSHSSSKEIKEACSYIPLLKKKLAIKPKKDCPSKKYSATSAGC
jgi:hypothetical protein